MRAAYGTQNEESKFASKVFPGLGHNFGPEAKAATSESAAVGDEIDNEVQRWFERYLTRSSL